MRANKETPKSKNKTPSTSPQLVTTEATTKSTSVTIKAPNLRVLHLEIEGTSPYVQHRFSKKAEIMATQAEGSRAKNKKAREPKDFEKNYLEAMHKSPQGWCGIPAPAFRNAMISACRMVGFQMTKAKLSIFVLHDGVDQDGCPIVKIDGKPERYDASVRNDSGVVDIRSRPMWKQWSATVRVQYDADQFNEDDVANLMMRVGMQVGLGEGRHDSKDSCGLGFGCFCLVAGK